jgi:hypothetical protein
MFPPSAAGKQTTALWSCVDHPALKTGASETEFSRRGIAQEVVGIAHQLVYSVGIGGHKLQVFLNVAGCCPHART